MKQITPTRPGLIVASLVIANFLAQLMQTMLNTALPRMMTDLGIQEDKGQWLITVYFLVAGIVVPVAGFLLGRFSTRALFFASGAAFITGTLLAAVSADFALVLSGRLIQGAGAGLLMPLFQTTILRVFPKEKIGLAMGLVGLVMGLAPALGPALSGLVVEHHSWRILFYGVLPVAMANLVLAWFTLRNVGERSEARLDLRSVMYSSLGFAGLMYGLSTAGDQGGSALFSWAVLLAGSGMIAVFIGRQLKLSEPLLDFRLFRYRMFTHASVIGVILFFVMIGVELFLPLYAQKVRGLTPRESGLMLLPGALLMGISGLCSGRLYDRFGARMLTRISFLCMTVTLLLLAVMIPLEPPFLLLMLLFALFMIEIGFIMSPITAFTMTQVPANMIKHASPMTITLRSLSGSMSGVVLVSVMTSVSLDHTTVLSGGLMLGIQLVFWILAAMAGLGFVLTFLLNESVKLDDSGK
ncbi:DHA2 family efflux MFS transporter permease subunit [Paenibacillus wynnii]|uniref:EmrB/QacA subfamily drug resistance transporter n=1 Tax=Paenibacillus wynnii TaxID=268407 RepID=A0A098M8K7_9BACL|nr:DHA2 family efflux MFS transporter permease subunit [Paenibacillus wynnii]KGE18884.1 EmrB/QacA subfamily drug resistance transporter [Paenibacillus wynnii]